MKPFEINLNQAAKTKHKYRSFLIIRSLLLIAASLITFFVVILINRQPNIKFNYYWIILICAVYVAYYIYSLYSNYKTKLYVKTDDIAFSYRLGYNRKSAIFVVWDTIKKVKIGTTYISFYKKTGVQKKISLGWLSYKELTLIKNAVEDFAKMLGVTVEKAEIYGQH